MADDKKETEQTVKSADAAEQGASTVKKETVKKKTAPKKAAKKKVASKQPVAKKAAPAAATQPESKPVAPSAASTTESKPATVTNVAAASSMAAAKAAPSKVNVEVKAKKKESSEETSMSTGAKSSSGFWVKVLFWLIILVLGFIYIRTLAKHPAEETPATATAQSAVQTTSAPMADGTAAQEKPAAGTLAPVHSVTIADKASSADQTMQEAKAEPAQADASDTAAAAKEDDAAATAMADNQSGLNSAPATREAGTGDTLGSPMTRQQVESMRDQHAESVSKILKEFDDLREAAQAEMDAMRNLMQAERELHEAMTAPPPAAYPPAWRGPAYSPYATGPQYSPYTRP